MQAQVALWDALTAADAGGVKQAIAQGADIHIGTPEDPLTPLILAANEGWLEVVEVLLDAGADPNGYFVERLPGHGPVLVCALGQADAYGHSGVVALLESRGALSLGELAAAIANPPKPKPGLKGKRKSSTA